MPQGDSAPCLRSLFVSALGTFLEFSAWICVELCWSLGPGLVKEDSGASQGATVVIGGKRRILLEK